MQRLLGGVLLVLALCLAAGGGGSAARPGLLTGAVAGAEVPCERDLSGGDGGSAPDVDFDDSATSAVVGSELRVSGTVTGTTAGTVRVRVVSGPNAGDRPEVTRSGARFAAVHRSEEPGDDVLEAVLVVAGDVVARARTRHTWTELEVETPVVRVTPEESTGPVGEPHTVRITVEGTDGTGEVSARVEDGPHISDLEVTGSGTDFSATYEGDEPGTDAIQATLTFRGRTVTSNTASRTWQEPADVSLTLRPSGTTAEVGSPHRLEIEVEGSDERPVLHIVRGEDEGVSLEVSGGERRYSATYSSETAGTDALQASLPDSGVESNVAVHTWTSPPTPDPSISIDPDQAKTLVGQVHSVTVRVSDTEEQPQLMLFRAGSSGGEGLDLEPVGGDAYEASYEFGDQQAGTDRLVASVAGATAEATNTWFGIISAPPPGSPAVELVSAAVTARGALRAVPADGPDCLSVALAPAGAASQVGSDLTLTALVRDDRGDPVEGARVDFVAAGPEADDVAARVGTGPDGVARFTYSRDDAGSDTVTARVTADIGTGTGTTSHRWLADDGLTVSVLPDATTSSVGSPFTATVTVLDDDDEPVEGAEVDVSATMPDAAGVPEEAGSGVADDFGRFSFTYTREAAGSDTIAVTARDGDREAVGSGSHVWENARGLGVELQPAGATSLVDSQFTATALVTRDGQPVEGADVAFSASWTDSDTDALDSTVVTTADGLASFGYTRDVEGDEVVSVVVTAEDDAAEAAMAHTWVLVPGLAVAIGPAGTATPVDADFTATVTATDNGEPIEDADVVLSTVMPGRDDAPQSGQTGADGRAELTWTRETPGLEQVLAEVTVDGDTGPAAMAHLWAGTPIGRPGLDVTSDSGLPGAPVTATGRGCPSESDVAFSVGQQRLGGTSAGTDGTYRASLAAPDLGIGRHTLTAECAPVTASAPLDVVVTGSATGTAGAAAATVAVVLTFFVLLGGQLVRVNTHAAGGGV